MANSEAKMGSDAAQVSGGDYQVFLSFRGPDTRHGFTAFLYDDLRDAGVRVFRDDDELQAGNVIGDSLLKAINNSIIYMPVFSQTYASSIWCLRELARMVDKSKSEGKKIILPIFFHVEPDDVKLRTPLYSEALLKHEEKFPNEVEAWRKVLKEVGKISGWNVEKNQSQPRIVKLVVKRVLEELEIKQKSVTEHLVGHDQVEKLRELLHVNHGGVRLIGIYGMGGIGKTTIAKVVFNELCSHFGKRCSFLEGVRERSSKEGIVQLQKKLLFDIVDANSAEEVKNIEGGMRRIGETFPTEKVLVVLDDVDKKEHIMKLIGNSKLRSGSRIIITTRDTAILQVERFEGEIRLYEMLKMDDGLALQLFCRHAFGTDFPWDVYRDLSSEIVSRMGGLPLAIEVVGSLLEGKNEAFWKETLARIKKDPEEEVLNKLRISYDDLDKYQKQIFLDIACFFFNEKKTDAIYMWAECSFYPERGIDVLTNRCLIKILGDDKLWMHDQLIDLGRQIVREESQDDLGKQSRLWIAEEALQIIKTEERKHKVQGLEIHEPFEITNEDFERLPNLRFLDLNEGTYAGDFAMCHSNLKWFSWHYPQDFRADKLYMDRLVVCKLYRIDFKDDSKAWDLIKRAQNLKVLCITQCYGITTIPNFSKCSGLERLTLAQCRSLNKIERFIGNLGSLIELKIEECWNLRKLPKEVGELVKLKHFSLSGCHSLIKLPDSLGNLASLIELDLSRTCLSKLPNSIDGLVKLESFTMKDNMVREFPNSIGKLKSLRILRLPLDVSRPKEPFVWQAHVWQLPNGIGALVNLEELVLSCRDVTGEIPVEIGELSSLKILNLESTLICGIPRTINKLHHLQTLNLRWCPEIRELPELPSSLTRLFLHSKSLLSVPDLSNLTNLVELELSSYHYGENSKTFTGCDLRWIGKLSKLKKLELDLLNAPAPPELASLSHLEELVLGHLDLKALGQLPSSKRNASTLNSTRCEVEDIPLDGFPRLQKLRVDRCKRLQRLSIPSELRQLQQVYVRHCQELVEIQVEVGLSKSLDRLSVYECESLAKISGLSSLKNLEGLTIKGCNALNDVEGLDELESLKRLDVSRCTSLRKLIDASCTKIPDDCEVYIQACGDFVKDSSVPKCSLKSYKEKILKDGFGSLRLPDGAEFDISGSDKVSDFASVGKSETDGTSSIDDFQSKSGNTECFEATGNRKEMRDGMIGRNNSGDEGKTTSMENRKKDKDEIAAPAKPSDVVGSSCQTWEGAEHYERSCKVTTEVEDQRDLSSISFKIRFHLGVKKSSKGFGFVAGIKRENEGVTPDSVTYEGLIANVKNFGFRLKRMWYETPGECRDMFIEIKSDEQVQGMVQLASKRGLIQLYIEGGVDTEWEGEYDDEMMEMLTKEWRIKTDDYSDETGANWDVSCLDEDLDSGFVGECETHGTSSVDDFQSESANAKCFVATGTIANKDLEGIQKQMELQGESRDEESAGDVTVSTISSNSLAADRFSEAGIVSEASRWSAEVDELERLLNADV